MLISFIQKICNNVDIQMNFNQNRINIVQKNVESTIYE